MTGLPQDFAIVKRTPLPDVPYEVQLWQFTHEDAKRNQNAASMNSASVRIYRGIDTLQFARSIPKNVLSATERHAAEQYAYARWLMGIDDYWLGIRAAVTPRPDYMRLPHQVLSKVDAAAQP